MILLDIKFMKKYIILIMSLSFLTQLSAKEYLASLFGIRSDGNTLNTSSIQKAVNFIHNQGGGTLVFNVGRYLTGSIEMKSDVSILLKGGAILVGSTSPYDYFAVDSCYSLIYAINQENISILGNGKIDCQSEKLSMNTIDQIRKGLMPGIKPQKESIVLKAIYTKGCNNVKVADTIMGEKSDGTVLDEQYFIKDIISERNATLKVCQRKKISISDFGAKSDGKTLNTNTIQHAIDFISDNGGGELFFEQGQYLTGSIYLKHNVTLHLMDGAVLLGSTNPFDYKKDPDIGRTSMIFAIKQKNVAIIGTGSIDGQGFVTANNTISLVHKGLIEDPLRMDRPDEINRPHNIYMRECDGVKIKGITLKDPASWTQAYDQCINVLIDGISVNSKSYWNNDGVDIVDCDSVTIRNSFFDSADDAICFKSHEVGKLNQNVLVENCIARASASAIKFGTASKGGFRNFTIRKIKVYDTYRSVITFATVDGGVIENISVDSIRAYNIGNVMYLRIGDRWSDGNKPVMRNITISNIHAEVAASKPDSGYNYKGTLEHLPRNISPASIIGLPEYRIQNISLRNIVMHYPGGGDPDYAERGLTPEALNSIPEMRKSYPEFSQFKELPAWGMYIRHADHILFENITFMADRKDYRPAIVCDDVHGIQLRHCSYKEPNSSHKNQVFIYKSDLGKEN